MYVKCYKNYTKLVREIFYMYKLFNTVNTYKYKALNCAFIDYTDRKYKNAFYT